MKKLLLLVAILATSITSAQWEVIKFTDDFGDPNGQALRTTDMSGKFTNSATDNSLCPVSITSQENGLLVFHFFEYGSGLAYFSDYNTYKLTMKLPNGEKINATMNDVSGNKGLHLYKKHKAAQAILNNKSGDIRAVLVEVDGTTKYVFTIKPNK